MLKTTTPRTGDKTDDSSRQPRLANLTKSPLPMVQKPSENDNVNAAKRGLSRIEAATYVGLSPAKFDQLVKDGRMPKPKRIDARVIWDRWKLDQYFTELPGNDDHNPWNDDDDVS
jgi:predicted DNA-binding transcriptional regulator AlpA